MFTVSSLIKKPSCFPPSTSGPSSTAQKPTKVTVTCSGFPEGDPIKVRFDDKSGYIGSATARAGEFPVTFTIPMHLSESKTPVEIHILDTKNTSFEYTEKFTVSPIFGDCSNLVDLFTTCLSSIYAGYAASSTEWLRTGPLRTGQDVPVTYTDVKGIWNVPTVSCSSSSDKVSVWVGLGGFYAAPLEQIGIVAECNQTKNPTYAAIYEMLPQQPTAQYLHYACSDYVKLFCLPIPLGPTSPLKITAGDLMEAEVIYDQNTGNYVLTLHNETKKWHRSLTIPTAQAKDSEKPRARSSAECIVESPVVRQRKISPLPDFGTFTFSRCFAASDGGELKPIGSVGPDTANVKFTMVTSDHITPKTKTSDLSSTKAVFNVIWKQAGP